MAVIAVGSVRSCGATTLALALAATWPAGSRVLLAEMDPAGGTLAAASGWPPAPGLVSLAAGARRSADPEAVWAHCQRLPGGIAVLAGPASADEARSALSMLGPLVERLGELDAHVLADCGRLDPRSPSLGIWERAECRLVAVRPQLPDLGALSGWLGSGVPGPGSLALVPVGDGPYPDREIEDTLGVEVASRLPWDPAGAEGLLRTPASSRRLRVAPLVRSARSVAESLCAEVTRAAPGAPAAGEPASRRFWQAVSTKRRPEETTVAAVASSNGKAQR